MSKKIYIHEGGSLGDFDFLYEVLERDQVIKLKKSNCYYWKRRYIGAFCKQRESTPTTYLYERLKEYYIRPGSTLETALCQLVDWAEREINKLGYKLMPRDEYDWMTIPRARSGKIEG